MNKSREIERRILTNVEEHGCHVMHVFDPEGVSPSFSYSVGFPDTVGQPEIIVFGLPSEMMHYMINETYDQCRGGLELENEVRISGLLEGFECVARKVVTENIVPDYFSSAIWFSRHKTNEDLSSAFQVVWPGAASGLFPWDAGVPQDVIDAQPALYESAA